MPPRPHPDLVRRPSGVLTVRTYEAGSLIDTWSVQNLFLANGSVANALMLGAQTGALALGTIGFGTNGAAPAITDSALTNPYYKHFDSVTLAGSALTLAFSLATGEDNGAAIAEFGLLTGTPTSTTALATGALLYCRKNRPTPLYKSTAVTISGTWTLQY